jgi:AbrB family looped-hinge helix DNA binding protein
MRTTIDAAGRIVVPKPLREQLGLTGGQEVEISVRDGRLEIDVPATPMALERQGEALVAVPERELPPLTVEIVRETLERLRR